jgi:hypothetical protein
VADLTIQEPFCPTPSLRPPPAFSLPYQLAARIANVVMTAQVQVAYASAIAAGDNAHRAADYVERAWPDTPLRSLVARTCREHARERRQAASDVLRRARARCGLAYARLAP